MLTWSILALVEQQIVCTAGGGFGSVQAAMDSSLPQTTHASGSQPGGRVPHKGPQDKPEPTENFWYMKLYLFFQSFLLYLLFLVN